MRLSLTGGARASGFHAGLTDDPSALEIVAVGATPDGTLLVMVTVETLSLVGRVDIYGTDGHTHRGPVQVGQQSLAMAITPDSTLALVSNTQSNTVSVVDLASATVVRTIPVGGSPNGIAITPDSRRALVACALDPNIMVIDIADGTVERFLIGAYTAGIGLARDGSAALAVSGDGSATVFFI
jgi:YVTN family beta-propeller protein